MGVSVLFEHFEGKHQNYVLYKMKHYANMIISGSVDTPPLKQWLMTIVYRYYNTLVFPLLGSFSCAKTMTLHTL